MPPTHPCTTTPPAVPPDSRLTSGISARGRLALIVFGQLSDRGRAILRAVAGGGAELSVSCEPDLFLEGRCCSDQATARSLVRAGFITTISPITEGRVEFGRRVAARLTTTGQQAMAPAARSSAEAPAEASTSALVGGGSR